MGSGGRTPVSGGHRRWGGLHGEEQELGPSTWEPGIPPHDFRPMHAVLSRTQGWSQALARGAVQVRWGVQTH